MINVKNGKIESYDIVIPDGVTEIFCYDFYSWKKLKSVTIPDSVLCIGTNAFRDCTGLTSITIPNSVEQIGMHAFDGCVKLTSITIPDSVTSIGSGAFSNCTGIESITIPNSVTSIGNCAFLNCTSLKKVIMPKRFENGINRIFGRTNLDITFTDDEELKPCPFCGGKAVCRITPISKASFVVCTYCGASIKLIEASPDYCAKDEAIKKWNTRVGE